MSDAERQIWDDRFAQREAIGVASTVMRDLLSQAMAPQPPGRALDLAGGMGRHALWLAAQGWHVTLADISRVGLARAQREAAVRQLPLEVRCLDFDVDAIPKGGWDLVVMYHYLNRDVLRRLAAEVTGAVALVHPTITNLERHSRPSQRFLLEPEEIQILLAGWRLRVYEEGWTEEGRHEAVVLAEPPCVA